LLHRLDNTQIGSVDVAIGKARTANNFKRSSKAFEDMVAGGGVGLRALSIPGVYTLEGGELIVSNGKIIGGIGVSGMAATQDAEVAKAGLAALGK
jgi:glc operon protein GlcG